MGINPFNPYIKWIIIKIGSNFLVNAVWNYYKISIKMFTLINSIILHTFLSNSLKYVDKSIDTRMHRHPLQCYLVLCSRVRNGWNFVLNPTNYVICIPKISSLIFPYYLWFHWLYNVLYEIVFRCSSSINFLYLSYWRIYCFYFSSLIKQFFKVSLLHNSSE